MPQFEPRALHTTLEGSPVVRVEMSNAPGVFAVVDRDDYDALAAAGFPTRWFINSTGNGYWYVRFSPGRFAGKLETVARTILGPRRGRVVKYRDGDRLNLRRSNLYYAQGFAPGATPADEEELA